MRPIFAFCCLFLLAVPVATQNKSINFAELEKTVGAELKENNTPGAAVVVISGERILFREDGKEFPLTKSGKDKFTCEQGQLIFASNARGEVEHLSPGLYAARKVMPWP